MANSNGSLNKSIIDYLNCPVCQELLKPPVIQCKNGHLVCKEHATSVKKCPTCKAKFSKVVPTVFNLKRSSSIQEPLSRRCNHPGCPENVVVGNDHEIWCGYRPIICHYDNTDHNCQWIGRAMKLQKHVKETHKDFNRCIDNTPSAFDNIPVSNIDITKHTGWGVAHETFFWVDVEMNSFKHYISMKITMVPIVKPVGTFHAWVEFRSKTSKLCMAVELDMNPNTDYSEKNSVKVHTDVLKDGIEKDGRLWYKLHITKDDDRAFLESFF